MGDTLGLLFKITADSGQAKADITSLRATIANEVGQIRATVPSIGGAWYDARKAASESATSMVGSTARVAEATRNAALDEKVRNEQRIKLIAQNIAVSRAHTDALIAESKSTVAGLDKQVLGYRNAGQAVVSAFDSSTKASGGLAAGVGIAGVAIGALAGTTTLTIPIIMQMVASFFEWITAERELVAITAKQIETTQQRIDLLKEELDVALRLAAAKGDAAAARAIAVEALKREIALSVERQQIQENALINDLTEAVRRQGDAEVRLNNFRIMAIQTGGTGHRPSKCKTRSSHKRRARLKR